MCYSNQSVLLILMGKNMQNQQKIVQQISQNQQIVYNSKETNTPFLHQSSIKITKNYHQFINIGITRECTFYFFQQSQLKSWILKYKSHILIQKLTNSNLKVGVQFGPFQFGPTVKVQIKMVQNLMVQIKNCPNQSVLQYILIIRYNPNYFIVFKTINQCFYVISVSSFFNIIGIDVVQEQMYNLLYVD
eukprot:TRINITY_DN3897_c1_g1_i1.p3 TRINITY_DN3897_c1_g1~~TRINITY_DN3897_c1_g1_i1.p3  ORF type:complete len:189 (+),score=-19.03 TRINITY_DN3897_c1_g1_i1:1105-1671(+)